MSAADFPLEPSGRAPTDGDGLIPNPATPTGSPIGRPRACAITFNSQRGATSTSVNRWVAAHENTLTGETVVCLAGVFRQPLHVWSKTAPALLEIAPAPHSSARLELGTVRSQDVEGNEYWGDAGGISIVDSRSVEIYGLTVEGYHFDGTGESPAGIYVTTRSDTQSTNSHAASHLSECFWHGGACSDIYILDNRVSGIANTADENHRSRSLCNNTGVDAYGIAVIAAGSTASQQLQHVVIEGNTVTDTRTGESETMTVNGAVRDFLVARNIVDDADNIGIDTIGWETGGAQATHGYLDDNTVYNIDTWSNAAYGSWDAATGSCKPLPENAAGLYDDGASFIWFGSNTVWNTDQGIDLDVETPHKETDHLLVSDNVVREDPGTSQGDPSRGPNPPGQPGSSAVAGHDPYALYVDAFGRGASISDVYVHDNVLQNESQHFLTPSDGMPVVDLGGIWSHVEIWHNTIEGMRQADRFNPLLEVDNLPRSGPNPIDCNDYERLSQAGDTVNGNFALPATSFLTLRQWQLGNKEGWDAHSGVDSWAAGCPSRSIP